MTTLLICRGLPASGKTTFARRWVSERRAAGGRAARVNRDDFRAMLFGKEAHGVDEPAVTQATHAAIVALLTHGTDVVSDDTNLNARNARTLAGLAVKAGATIEVKDFTDVPVEVCVERDAARAEPVGEAAVRKFHDRYLAGKRKLAPLGPPAVVADKPYVAPVGAPSAVIVDIDGTLALMRHRSPFDWSRVGEDEANRAVVETVRAFDAQGHRIVVMSGRDGSAREATVEWLARHEIRYDELHMRAAGDTRKDSIVKGELFDAHVRDTYDVLCVLDDRDQVVQYWRSLGLVCMQVAPGNF